MTITVEACEADVCVVMAWLTGFVMITSRYAQLYLSGCVLYLVPLVPLVPLEARFR